MSDKRASNWFYFEAIGLAILMVAATAVAIWSMI